MTEQELFERLESLNRKLQNFKEVAINHLQFLLRQDDDIFLTLEQEQLNLIEAETLSPSDEIHRLINAIEGINEQSSIVETQRESTKR